MLLKTFEALSFGALGFLVLKECRKHRVVWGGRLFGFTLLAWAFFCVLNLADGLWPLHQVLRNEVSTLSWLVKLTLPPLMLNVLYLHHRGRLERPAMWVFLVTAGYLGAAAVFALALPFAKPSLPQWLAGIDTDDAFVLHLGLVACTLICLIMTKRGRANGTDRAISALAALLVLLHCVNFKNDPGWMSLARELPPITIAFTLAYFELRLAFFDVLVKRVTFFLFGLVAISAYYRWITPILRSVEWGRGSLWVHTAAISPLLLATPWAYAMWARRLDRIWLARRYTPLEAGQAFLLGIGAYRDHLRLEDDDHPVSGECRGGA
jgi:hypothetical protein